MKFLKERFGVFALVSFEDVWLQKFGPFGVSQEDVLENLIEENYCSQVLTTTIKKRAQRRVFVASIVR